MTPNLNRYFRQFLTGINSTKVHNPSSPGLSLEAGGNIWPSGYWYLPSLSQCHDGVDDRDASYFLATRTCRPEKVLGQSPGL